jgi:lipoprotein-releasing system permease protein
MSEQQSGRPTKRWSTEDIDQPWSIGDGIGVAMRRFFPFFPSLVLPLIGVELFYLLVSSAVGFVFGRIPSVALFIESLTSRPSAFMAPAPPPVPLLAAWGTSVLLFLLLTSALSMAMLSDAALAAVRSVPVRAGFFGRALKNTPRFAGLIVLFYLTAFGPSLAIVAPFELRDARSVWEIIALLPLLFLGNGFVICFAFTPFFIVDDDDGLLKAMRKSWRATKHYLGVIFLFIVALTPLSILSALPIIGHIPSAFIFLGLAYGYARSTGRNDLEWFEPEFATRSVRRFLQIMLGVIAVAFGVLFAIVRTLPDARGTAFSIRDTAIRASAILTGVAGVIVLLALLLPYILDGLEGERFTYFVAARHVRSQKSGFLTVISILSICGVAISSCALSSVVSVMGGFSQDLKRKILGNNAHIVVDTTAATPWTEYDDTLAKVRAVPGVSGATPVVRGEVMASSASNLAGVIVSGIDTKTITSVIDLDKNMEVGKLEYLEHPEQLTRLPPTEVIGIGPGGEKYYKGAELPALPTDDIDPSVRAVIIQKPDRPGIILGRELAKTLHVYVGDEVTLVSPLGDLGPMGLMPRTKRFRVAGVFYSGMYEYDATYVYTLMGDAQEYFATGDKITSIEVKVADAEGAEQVTPKVIAAIGRDDLRVRDWREINKNLFSALKLERFATFIILSLAIMVASFCIVCTLLLMVTEKGKEIAILKAIGASDGMILRTFMIEGVIIGAIGTVFGVVSALALCSGLAWFGLRLDPEVYYIDRLPISVNGWDFLTVALAAMAICTLSTVYPAYAASKLRPVDGLRYE